MDDFSIQCAQLCSILDSFSIGVITVSPNRRIMSMNTAAELLTGHKKKDVIGKYCHQAFVRDLCGRECKLHETIHSEQKVLRPPEPSSVHPRGRVHRAALNEAGAEIRFQQYEKHYITKVVSPLYTSGEGVVGCIVVFQDHSAFRDLIDRIRERRLLRSALERLARKAGNAARKAARKPEDFGTWADSFFPALRQEAEAAVSDIVAAHYALEGDPLRAPAAARELAGAYAAA